MSLEKDPDLDPLIARIINRDGEAMADYIQRNHESLLRFIRSISSDKLLSVVEPEDMLQEVCTAALSGLDSAPLDEYSPLQWLQQIARRRVVDAHRFHFEAKRRDAGRQRSIHGAGGGASGDVPVGLEAMLAASMTSPSAAFSRDIRMIRMQEAVETLGEDQREAIRLRYTEGMPTKEIAEKIGKSDAAVRVLLSRSLRLLEKSLVDVRPTRD